MVNEPSKKQKIEEEERMIDHQQTFVLAYHCLLTQSFMGAAVSEFEKSGLQIKEMRCMAVTQDFAHKHVLNIGLDPEAFSDNIPLPFGSWVSCIAYGLNVAMVVEGDDAVQKVHDLVYKKKQPPFWAAERQTVCNDSDGKMTQKDIKIWRENVYTSNSPEQVEKDVELWFGPTDFDENIDLDKIAESTKVVFVLPGGKTLGPLDQVKDAWKLDPSYEKQQDFKAIFFMKKMCVLLIKPLAFEKHCVGEILDVIEANCGGIRGLKLVKKSKHPSRAWPSDSVSYGDKCGVAVVVYDLDSSLKILPGNSNVKIIDFRRKMFEICSNYLYKSEQGEEVLEAASEFFDYGFNVWASELEGQCLLHGCMFEASLVGLQSLLY